MSPLWFVLLGAAILLTVAITREPKEDSVTDGWIRDQIRARGRRQEP